VGNEGLWAVSVGGSWERISSCGCVLFSPQPQPNLGFLVSGWSLVPADEQCSLRLEGSWKACTWLVDSTTVKR
jgi:hypothetical protein